MKKNNFVKLIVLVLVGILAGCGSKSDSSESNASENEKELSIAVWNYESAPEFQLLFKEFEEREGVKINPVNIAAADYETKLTTMLSSGDQTDVLAMKSLASYSMFAYRDQLLDLTDHVEATVDKVNYNGVYDELTTSDGKIFAQPYRNDFYVLLYNKKMFDEAGLDYPDNLTWEEYEELAKKLTNSDEQVYGTYHHYWYMLTLSLAAAQEQKDLLDTDYSYALPQYERFVRMQDEGSAMPFGTAKSTQTTYNSQFENEKAAMMPMGTWYLTSLLHSIESGNSNVEWGISEVPQLEKGKDVTTMGHSTSFSINKNAANSELAQKFLDFASSKEAAILLSEIGVSPAFVDDEVRNTYFEVVGMPTDEVSKRAYNPDEIGRELPMDKLISSYDKIFLEENELIMVEDAGPKEGLDSLSKRIENED